MPVLWRIYIEKMENPMIFKMRAPVQNEWLLFTKF
jgi:hypothetical protein